MQSTPSSMDPVSASAGLCSVVMSAGHVCWLCRTFWLLLLASDCCLLLAACFCLLLLAASACCCEQPGNWVAGWMVLNLLRLVSPSAAKRFRGSAPMLHAPMILRDPLRCSMFRCSSGGSLPCRLLGSFVACYYFLSGWPLLQGYGCGRTESNCSLAAVER